MAITMTREPVHTPAMTGARDPRTPGVAARLLRLCNASWRALEAMGRQRAERELRRLALTRSDHSDLARQLRAAADRLAEPGQ